jgi:hypothetical protein
MPRLSVFAQPADPETGNELRERSFDRMKRVAKLTPHGETLHQVASDVEEVLIEGCGRYVPEERPVELAGAIMDFLIKSSSGD